MPDLVDSQSKALTPLRIRWVGGEVGEGEGVEEELGLVSKMKSKF